MKIDNPYWDEVGKRARRREWPYEGGLEIGNPMTRGETDYDAFTERYRLTPIYSWTITDPESLRFVAKYAGKLFDPMAGNGYWAYCLQQMGVDVICYDLSPQGNHWHPHGRTYVPVMEMDCAEAAGLHADRTMLLSWPPMDQAGERALTAYQGSRVIFIGEPPGGATGNDELYRRFGRAWTEKACHRPVQWWGIHDYITVFDS